MGTRLCLDCEQPTKGTRCDSCKSKHEQARDRRRAPFVGDRYGKAYRAERAWWEPKVAAGGVDCRRGQEGCLFAPEIRIRPGQKWNLGHPDEECPKPMAPEHEKCNTSAGGRAAHA